LFCGSLVLALNAGCGGKKTVKKDSKQDKMAANADAGSMKKYLVRSGDSLWRISSKGSVMGDPFQWPLLFKSNRDQIEDPDLIEPRQDLSYKETYSREEINEAVQKAKETPPYVPHSKPRRVLPVKY
jgi:hypothetical protein